MSRRPTALPRESLRAIAHPVSVRRSSGYIGAPRSRPLLTSTRISARSLLNERSATAASAAPPLPKSADLSSRVRQDHGTRLASPARLAMTPRDRRRGRQCRQRSIARHLAISLRPSAIGGSRRAWYSVSSPLPYRAASDPDPDAPPPGRRRTRLPRQRVDAEKRCPRCAGDAPGLPPAPARASVGFPSTCAEYLLVGGMCSAIPCSRARCAARTSCACLPQWHDPPPRQQRVPRRIMSSWRSRIAPTSSLR